MLFQVQRVSDVIRKAIQLLPAGVIVVCAVAIGTSQTPTSDVGSADLEKTVRPFVAGNCMGCHNSHAKMAGLDLESGRKPVLEDRPTWDKVLAKLKSGQMPPPGAAKPNAKDLQAVIAKLEGAFRTQDAALGPDPGHVAPHRLNRTEYNNTVRDLLGLDLRAADDFPQDDAVFGFDNIADSLSVSPLLMEKYIAAAEKIANAAIFGLDLKPEPVRFDVAIPRRMETTNTVQITSPAYYSVSEYDVTGLSQPGSYHLSYPFPVSAEYVFKITGAGTRPAGSEPTTCEFWVDGKLAKTFDVGNVGLSGFERRPDIWEARLRLTAGTHEFVVAYPRQYDGLPAKYGGKNPSKLPEPPVRNPGPPPAAPGTPVDNRPGKVEERRIAAERAKRQAEHPTWAGLSVNEFDIVGPYGYTRTPSPETRKKIFICDYTSAANQPACLRQIISNLATRAFRRPLSAGEADPFVTIAENAKQRSGSFEHGVSVGLRAILVSPDFLFRIERQGVSDGSVQRITDYELASRLSYFLWSSMPDEELTRRAADGSLKKPEVLRAQVKRMLTDPKAGALADNFADEWLEVRRLESITPDRDRFPDFDDYLRDSMKQETGLFVRNLLQNDGSILDLIDGKYTFLNERLAAHYGIPGVKGTNFRRVDLTGTTRSGVLTQGSVLTVSSYANRTSPVLRGKWVLENFLNAPPPPPPPNVPSLNEAAVGSSVSLRQQMEQHRANPVCASCHTRMDPMGFGLENYDAVGTWREKDGNVAIDASGVLPDGRTFRGAEGLKSMLRSEREAFANGVASKMLTYALGRGVEKFDRPVIQQIVQRLKSDDYKVSSLVLEIANSFPFQMQRVQMQKGAGAQ